MTSPATKKLPSCGDRTVAVGGLPTLIASGVEIVVFTPSETESLAEYWTGLRVGVCRVGWVEVVPSPNVHE